jgi:hypothetical protein
MSTIATALRTFDARIAELGFTVPAPPDWISQDLPTEVPDFSDGTALVPLAVVTAPHSALILAIAARPAYDDGTLHDWTRYLLQHAGLTPRSLGEHAVGSLPALVGEATQTSDMGPMVVRFAFCEDGRRLLNITLTAPEMLAGTVQALWFEILAKFALTTPRGPTVPVMAGRAVGEVNVEVAAPEEPEPAPQPKPQPAPGPEPLPAGSPLQAPSEPQTFSMHALADDTATLDPEHKICANLRERGIGLTPRILAVHPEDRRATIGAGALGSIIDVPFGWHVMDDGAHTLLLEPSGAVQIHMELVPRDDRDNDTILDAIESGARDAYPSPRFHRHAERGLFGIAVLGIHDGATELAQVHVLRQIRDDGMLIRARITAEPNRIIASTNLGELILNSARWGEPEDDVEPTPTEPDLPEEEPTPKADTARSETSLPEWYQRAMQLERDGDVKGAELLLKDSIPHAAYAMEIASMHRTRMLRFAEAGDLKAARASREQAVSWAYTYAGFATSGGEGAAFSWERDQFLANLPEV